MIALVFAAALMAAAPAAAESTAQTTQTAQQTGPAAKSDKPKKEDLVCKKEAVVGSRMKTRVCMTQADWDQRTADSRDELEKSQSVKPLAF